ncbi:PUL domain protein [Dictyocaulus viviparus]|uniref:PUL domain protein n=1 Tax=Dictyocaulus viviparus TaxID=29172 RepID=A0A0D8YA18_DICVI|nr:PUL domain protein [Dictyocaulus viviparus]
MNDVEMKTAEEGNEFYLSRVIEAHKTDVKCLTSTSAGVIISGGRDEFVRFWSKRGGEFSETFSFAQPKGLIVNSIGYYESSDGWRVFAGRKDVCCLYVDEKNHILLSGSWDNNVIVWPIKEIGTPEYSALLLTGHTYSVWALAAIESSPGFYITGSADKSIKLWHNDIVVRTYTGHNDVVRAILVISADLFLSAGNDASIRLWHVQSDVCLATFSSLIETFIFSLAFVDSYVLSCSEGGHIEVWKQTGVEDTFSDGCIYVFTQKESHKASSSVRTAFENAIAAKVAKELERRKQKANETVRISVSLDDGVPNMELLYTKGTDPVLAAEKFVKDYNLPFSYVDEITEYIKGHIPEAAAAARRQHKVQPTERVTVDGEVYDYAFDVTVDDGRKLRLLYNLKDDPDIVAQRFVEKHNLPISFLAKTSLFVTNLFYEISSSSIFSGGCRYVPQQPSCTSSTFDIVDPFTGTARYVPSNSSKSASVDGSGDPYTISASPLSDKKRPRSELVPVPSYYRFGIEQLSSKALTKLVEMNAKQPALKLNTLQIDTIQRLMSGSEDLIDYDIVTSALDVGLQWTMNDLVPILDVFRVALLHEYLNTYFCDMKKRGESTHRRLLALLMSEPPDAISILVCRSLANAFAHPCGREMLCHDFQNLFAAVTNQLTSNKAALQLAATSTLANWSLLLLTRSETVSELGPREDAIRQIVKANC